MWRWGNLLGAFLAELIALGIFASWGWAVDGTTLVRLLLAIGLPAVTAVVWGLFAAPTATRGTPVVRTVVKVLVFGLAGAALWSLGHPVWAVVFVLVIAVNLLIIRVQKLSPDGNAA
ncbi:YrdB family protein [Kribbella sp. NPDC023972]|uniref:YrdB family protein n=1 Tax=Kribbella sp. NPDC023972 TaxID=3154795 RepID=UPI0033E532A7